MNEKELLKELTFEQLKEYWYKSLIYGIVFIIKYDDGTIEIKTLEEIENKKLS